MKWIIVAICLAHPTLYTNQTAPPPVTATPTTTTWASSGPVCPSDAWRTRYRFADRRACEGVVGVMNVAGGGTAYYCQRSPRPGAKP